MEFIMSEELSSVVMDNGEVIEALHDEDGKGEDAIEYQDPIEETEEIKENA